MADELEDFVLTGGQGQCGVGAHGRLPVAVSKNTELPTLAEEARDTVNIYSAGQRRKSIRPMAVCIAPVVLRHPFRWLVRARSRDTLLFQAEATAELLMQPFTERADIGVKRADSRMLPDRPVF